MACPIIIRRHEGVQSYLVLDDNPRELLRHVGFAEPVFRTALAGVPGPRGRPGRMGRNAGGGPGQLSGYR